MAGNNPLHPTHPTRVKVGTLVGVHGVHGRVKIRALTEDPADITSYGTLYDAKGAQVALRVTSVPPKGGMAIAELEGVTRREQAEALVGTELFVEREKFPQAEEGSYYHADLIGLPVRSEEGEVGHIIAIHNYGAGDIFEIRFNGSGAEEMYLFDRKTFPEVNVAEGYVRFNPPAFLVAKE